MRGRDGIWGLAFLAISMTTISGLFSPVPMEEMGPKYARKKAATCSSWRAVLSIFLGIMYDACIYSKYGLET